MGFKTMAMHRFIEVKLVLTGCRLGSNIKMVAGLASSPSTDIFGFRKFETHSKDGNKFRTENAGSKLQLWTRAVTPTF